MFQVADIDKRNFIIALFLFCPGQQVQIRYFFIDVRINIVV